ncbi:MAG: hypothetical protein AAFQ98_25295, partial [Bacteroidota bacterium]
MPSKHRILLGTLGDDIHTVGIKLIQQTLVDHGYFVTFLGIQNELQDFFEVAADHEVIMISSLNGHSHVYLDEFPSLMSHYQERFRGETKLWYLGGNIVLNQDPLEVEKRYRQFGFTRVFVKPVGTDEILSSLQQDLYTHEVKPHDIPSRMLETSAKVDPQARYATDTISDLHLFRKEREVVLNEWKNGFEIRKSNIKEVHSQVKSLPKLLFRAKTQKQLPLIQPRTGVATIKGQQKLLADLGKHAMDISSVQLDAACRVNNYVDAEKYMLESLVKNKSLLNGFPVPVHGPDGLGKIIKTLDKPFQVRGGGPDHRFVYETSIAGGASGVEGGFLCYLMPYTKDRSPSESLSYWKYVDTLVGQYMRTHKVSVNREYFGTLTATLVEPSIPIVINIIQAVLSVKNGVKSITVGYAEQGNRAQDIAGIRVMEEMTHHYLQKNGLMHYELTTVFHQYMAAFPKTESRSEQLIHESSVTAALAGATKIMTKTPVESIKIPSVEENIRGVKVTHNAWKSVETANVNPTVLEAELSLLREEVTAIMDAIEELGKGEYSRGIMLAFQYGILDIPFCPNIYAKGEVLTFRGID